MHYEKKYDIFISYSHEDQADVIDFKVELEKLGYKVWLDKEQILIGQSLRLEVGEGLMQSYCICFWVTKNWKSSRWANDELDYVHAENKNGILIILDQGVKPPHLFSGRKYIRRNFDLKKLVSIVDKELQGYFINSIENFYHIIKNNTDVENAVAELQRLVSLYYNLEALDYLLLLMADESLSISKIDYCYRYFHIAFRENLPEKILSKAFLGINKLIKIKNETIIDKLCYSIGEIFLFAADIEARAFAKELIEIYYHYNDLRGEKMTITAARVGLTI